MKTIIEIENLTKDYEVGFWKKKKVRALDNLTLQVESGQIFGFLGGNGAGKTTTIKILMCLLFPSSGTAKILGRDISDVTGSEALYRGLFLATLGQCTYISAYCMLIFMARIQRYDRSQEEAALDLGASPTQVFRHIFIPYMMPAIVSAAAIAFLSSFENYNTTTFAILADKTLTTVLAGRVRQGTTPAISALAVVIIAVTVAGAFLFEALRMREAKREAARARTAADAERGEALAR